MKHITTAAAIALIASLASQTQAEVIHATWGGGGARTLADYVQKPFSEQSGIETRVAEVPNTAGAVRSPTASQYNAVTVTFFEGVGLSGTDLLEGFTDAEIPEVKNLPPEVVIRNDEGLIVGIPTYFAYYGIVYNSDLASAEDFASWNDLADPKWKGKLAITRPVYAAAYDLTMYAHANGGDAANIEPGVETLKGLISNALTTYTSLAHMNTLLGTGEVTAVPFYSTRVWHLQNEGQKNIKITIPKEGGLMLAYAVVSPKGAGNREETAKYLNYLASAESQVAVSVHGGGIPTNNTAKLPQEYLDTLGTTREALMKQMYVPDWKTVWDNHEERINMVEQIMSQVGN
ncbi:MAG: extracellular solute-binding protein [Pseudomonadota bacterium]|nr:extracellular solute-binding protein [Pseudomonadota bacterium]